MSNFIRPMLAGLAVAAAVAIPLAVAETTSLKADLKGSEEVPPVNSKATGSLTATYDSSSKMLSWKGNVSGLTDEVTAAHFHGPAEAGKEAPPIVPVTGVKSGAFEGSARVDDDKAKIIMDGKSYFNIHTKANPKGEVRGQVVKAK